MEFLACCDSYGLSKVADAGDLERLGFGRKAKGEFTVDIGQDPMRGELDTGHGSSDYRLFVVGCNDHTRDGV